MIFFISDTHLYHKNILKFTNPDGSFLRPGFKDLDDMHETIMRNWSRVIQPGDIVYHLGDVTFHQRGLDLIKALPGRKRLIRGNHDQLKTCKYLEVFEEIYGIKEVEGFWLTHAPMHPTCVNDPKVKANIHGHQHRLKFSDPKYFNVAVEHIGYTPISLDNIKTNLIWRQTHVELRSQAEAIKERDNPATRAGIEST